MTTWDMDTVRRVRRLGARVNVDPIVLAAHPGDVPEQVRRKAALQIVEEARALAVEVHPDDVAAVELERGEGEPEHAPVQFDIRWRPGWRDAGADIVVELRGGAADGTMFAIRPEQLHTGIVLHKPMPSLHLADVDQIGPTESLLSKTEHYQIAGWRESERRWVLATEGATA